MSVPGSSEWTLEQAAEVCLEQLLELLDGADDEDTVRPALALEALRVAWAPDAEVEPFEDDATAGEIRRRIMGARADLARGEMWIPS